MFGTRDPKYDVHGPDGEVLTSLNGSLARRQKVTDEQLEALKLSHQLRWMLFEAARDDSVKSQPLKLKLLAAMFEALEFEQQELWNFPRDAKFHRWFEFPGCICPKMDNAERVGSGSGIINCDCPIHGFTTTELNC
jgi:hypothetical protein